MFWVAVLDLDCPVVRVMRDEECSVVFFVVGLEVINEFMEPFQFDYGV